MSAFPILCALASISLAAGGLSAQPDESCMDSKVEYKTGRRDLLGAELLGASMAGTSKRNSRFVRVVVPLQWSCLVR